jgi:aldehyde dehydrogenase (NAD+)
MDFLAQLGVAPINEGISTGNSYFISDEYILSYSPVDGNIIAKIGICNGENFRIVVDTAIKAQKIWQKIPAPKRGEIIRQIGDAFRQKKSSLGMLISYEMGKSLQEGMGEVQEIIDICDYAVGLSRQLYGLSMHSERQQHRMYEQWHPLGVVGIITAFNFPAAVWGWNSMLAWVCGNSCIWKPSEKTPLTALACQKIVTEVLQVNNLPEGLSCLTVGDKNLGELMAADWRIPLISATGSTRMGKAVSATVGARLGRSLLELGGNNAIIITPSADMKLAILGSIFGATGTTGQRCTSTRRIIIHSSIYHKFIENITSGYLQLKIGNPLHDGIHVGPLIDTQAVELYLRAIDECKNQGGQFIVEGGVLEGDYYSSGCYVKPCIAEVTPNMPIVYQETFAPIVYVMKYENIEDAIAIQNNVPQGLSSAIFSQNIRESELFLSAEGSDCGIANVNIGTSGAEIGGAFGGEKETGGGRESGSDAWKSYMRRQTNTINYGTDLPLAQGIHFDIG